MTFSRLLSQMPVYQTPTWRLSMILYKSSALVLPHRPYDLLTGEFRSKSHIAYLGNDLEVWDPEKILKEAKYLHFLDWPVPKPWRSAISSTLQEEQPTCDINPATGQQDDCRARGSWLGFYNDFATRRKVGLTLVAWLSPISLTRTACLRFGYRVERLAGTCSRVIICSRAHI
ncbi:hypothetical protein BJX70DRAFT_364383 [Aspergillus crustosus]